MNSFVLSCPAWIDARRGALGLMAALAEANPDRDITTFIDLETIRRDRGRPDPGTPVVHLDLRNWVTEASADGGTLDFATVRRAVTAFRGDSLVVVDASGFVFDVVKKMLRQLRLAMFTAPQWPGGLAIVVDQDIAFICIRALEKTFHVRPEIMADATIRRQVTLMRRMAMVRKLLGYVPGTSRARKMMNRFNAWALGRYENSKRTDHEVLWKPDELF